MRYLATFVHCVSRVLIGAMIIGGLPSDVMAEDRFWILWEDIQKTGVGCPDGSGCITRRDYYSRMFRPDNIDWLNRMFGVGDADAATAIRADQHPEAPKICAGEAVQAVGLTAAQAERQFLSDSVDALRGLPGVGINLRNMRPPPGFSSDFGARLQAEFERQLKSVGVAVLKPTEAARLPGQPKLSVFLSYSDPDGGCEYTYSVFASLSQTALLTRDLQTKLSVGVWSFSAKPNTAYPDQTEYDAVLSVVAALVDDIKRANAAR